MRMKLKKQDDVMIYYYFEAVRRWLYRFKYFQELKENGM